MTPASPSANSLHHVGYVVPDIAACIDGWARSLAAAWDGTITEDPGQRARVAFLVTREGDAQIELVEPAGPGAPVSEFLRKGGGLHHVCYEVEDLDGELASFRARGAVIAKRPKPAVAFGNRRIAWILTSEKLLVELLERSASI